MPKWSKVARSRDQEQLIECHHKRYEILDAKADPQSRLTRLPYISLIE